jgi:hypothetical protein
VDVAMSNNAKIDARFRLIFSPTVTEKYDEKKSTEARIMTSVKNPHKGLYKNKATIDIAPTALMLVSIGRVKIICTTKTRHTPIKSKSPVVCFEIIERFLSCIKIIHFYSIHLSITQFLDIL